MSTPRLSTSSVEDAGGLDGVGVEDGAGVLRLDDARGLGDRLDGADLVVDVHDADEDGLGAVTAAWSSATSMKPSLSTSRYVTRKPSCSRRSTVWRTAWCSIGVVMM